MSFRLCKGDSVVAYHESGAALLGHVSDVNESNQQAGREVFAILFKGPGNVTLSFSPMGEDWHDNAGWKLAIPVLMLLGRKIT